MKNTGGNGPGSGCGAERPASNPPLCAVHARFMRVHPRLREAPGLPSRKRSMKPKTLARALAALCVAAAGLLYASPYIALHQIGKAVERRDAQALSGYVDFPALRESIKGQMMASLQSQMGGSGD